MQSKMVAENLMKISLEVFSRHMKTDLPKSSLKTGNSKEKIWKYCFSTARG